MYIWKVDPLIEDLKNNNVSQGEQLKYLLAIIILSTLGTDPIFYVGSAYSINDSISTVLMSLVSIWGLWLLNRSNVDGNDLILRFCTLGLPIGVRFCAWFLPVCLVLGFIQGFFGHGVTIGTNGEVSYATTLYFSVFVSFSMAIYYWRVAVAISKVCAEVDIVQ